MPEAFTLTDALVGIAFGLLCGAAAAVVMYLARNRRRG